MKEHPYWWDTLPSAARQLFVDQPLFDDRFPAIPLCAGNPWFLPMAGACDQVMDWLQ